MSVDVMGRSPAVGPRTSAERPRRLSLVHGSGGTPGARTTRLLVDDLVAITADADEPWAVPARRRALHAALAAWAHALVRTHRTPLAHFSPVAPLPWVLDEPLPDWLDDLPAAAGPVWAVREHPGIRRAIEAARTSWSAVQWMHGCATGDDVVLAGDGDAVLAELTTPQGRGDPRWDVATALDWLATSLGPALDPASRIDPAAVFLTAYRDAGGAATPPHAMAVARTVLTAVEWSARLAVGQDACDDDLAWLTCLWSRPLALVAAPRPVRTR